MRTAHSSSRLLGGVCLSAFWDTPLWVWPWPPGVGLNTPTGVGLDTPRPPNLPIGSGPKHPPPKEQNDWQTGVKTCPLQAIIKEMISGINKYGCTERYDH